MDNGQLLLAHLKDADPFPGDAGDKGIAHEPACSGGAGNTAAVRTSTPSMVNDKSQPSKSPFSRLIFVNRSKSQPRNELDIAW